MSGKTVEKSMVKLPLIIIAVLVFGALGYKLLPTASDIKESSVTDVELPQPDVIDSSAKAKKEDTTQVVTIDAVQEVKEEVEAKPFDLSKVLNDGTQLPAMAIGDPNAPIVLVEYSSLSCGHCGMFHKNILPDLKEKYVDTGKVYMIFREFPLNKPAVDGSKILRCLPEDKYYSFMNLLFETQKEWAYSGDYLNKLKQNAKLAGLTEEQINTCLADKDLEDKLGADLKIGSEGYKIRSTPSFVVNGGEHLIEGGQPLTFFSKIFDGILKEDSK